MIKGQVNPASLTDRGATGGEAGRVAAVRRTGTTSVRFSLCEPFLCQALSAGFGVYDDGRGNVVVLKLSPVIQARGVPKSRFRKHTR